MAPTFPTQVPPSCVLSHFLPFISTDFPRPASLIVLMMEAVQTSETLANSHQSARGYKPEDRHLHIYRRENLKS
jgi:hypothetical protein